MKIIIRFIKKEMVFCIASLISIITMFAIPPSLEYVNYIDFRVLSLLFCLMLVVSGLKDIGLFECIMGLLVRIIHTTRQLAYVLILACFFTSMWITNDVSLITFVPFTIMVLHKVKKDNLLIPIIVLQTIAANLGSMCTPIGNPQNLYLFSAQNMNVVEFVKIMMPYTIISLMLILVSVLFLKNEPITQSNQETGKIEGYGYSKVKLVVYCGLFVINILTVLHVLDYRLTLVLVIVIIAVMDKKIFASADYMLLLTFIAFFIFVGNVRNIKSISDFLYGCVDGNEVVVSIISSQFISNVPAAVLLSGFTNNFAALMVGTNIGGLGTVIASMASLISYKLYSCTSQCANDTKHGKIRFLGVFTIVNIIFLVALSLTACVIGVTY